MKLINALKANFFFFVIFSASRNRFCHFAKVNRVEFFGHSCDALPNLYRFLYCVSRFYVFKIYLNKKKDRKYTLIFFFVQKMTSLLIYKL